MDISNDYRRSNHYSIQTQIQFFMLLIEIKDLEEISKVIEIRGGLSRSRRLPKVPNLES